MRSRVKVRVYNTLFLKNNEAVYQNEGTASLK
jgi:hypothetical protein